MTVKQLIKILEKYPKSRKVLVNGFESGYDDIYEVKVLKLAQDKFTPDWEGMYNSPKQGETGKLAIAIERSYKRGSEVE